MYGNNGGPSGMYGSVQIMALDYLYRLWVELFGNKTKPATQREARKVVAPEAPNRQTGVAPLCCESY